MATRGEKSHRNSVKWNNFGRGLWWCYVGSTFFGSRRWRGEVLLGDHSYDHAVLNSYLMSFWWEKEAGEILLGPR